MNVAALQELTTLRDWVRWGAARFEQAGLCFGHGQDGPWDEATCLTLHALDVSLDETRLDWGMTLHLDQRRRVDDLLQRRIEERRPAAYLMGETRFAGLRMLVDQRALVPRSPIAELIEAQYRPWLRPKRLHRMLDLCTGGGCIAVASAARVPDLHVDAADLSDPALALARKNVALHRLAGRVRLIHSDLFGALKGRRYDLIVSNPPYVARDEYAELPREFGHEPPMGLLSGFSGFDLVLRILVEAPFHLNAEGVLIVEAGHGWRVLERLLPRVAFTWLEFERGGEGVFLLERDELLQAQSQARALRDQSLRRRVHGG